MSDQDSLTILDPINAVDVRTSSPLAGGFAALTLLTVLSTLGGLGFWGIVVLLVTFWPLTLTGLALLQSLVF